MASEGAHSMDTLILEVQEITAILSIVAGVFGLLGNLVCARMMASASLLQYSTSYFILGCVLCDSVVLFFECAEDIAILVPDVTAGDILYGYNPWRCRFAVFSYQMARVVSSWMVVAMCVEMVTVRYFRKRREFVYNPRRATYVTLASSLVGFAACFPFLVITRHTQHNSCSSKYVVFYDIYTDIVLQVITDGVVPILFISVCLIMFMVKEKGKFSNTISGSYSEKEKSKTSVQFASFIVVISLVFLISTLPDVAVQLMRNLERHGLVSMSENLQFYTSDYMKVVYYISKFLLTLNFASKFYVGFFFEEEYRRAFSKIFRYGQLKTVSSTTNLQMTDVNMDYTHYVQALKRTHRREKIKR